MTADWQVLGEMLFGGESASDFSPSYEEVFFLSVTQSDLGWFELCPIVRPFDRKTRSRLPAGTPSMSRAYHRG